MSTLSEDEARRRYHREYMRARRADTNYRKKEAETARRYRMANPDKVREQRRKLYEKQHPGAMRYGLTEEQKKQNKKVASRRVYEENKERYREWHRQNYLKNKERILARNRAWAKANPDRVRVLSLVGTNRRRVIQLQCEGSHTDDEWLALVEQCDGRCVCCGQQKKLTRDHIVPLARGGTDYIENIQPLCRECNSAKREKIIRYG